jgi:hypothetical protein
MRSHCVGRSELVRVASIKNGCTNHASTPSFQRQSRTRQAFADKEAPSGPMPDFVGRQRMSWANSDDEILSGGDSSPRQRGSPGVAREHDDLSSPVPEPMDAARV